MGIKYLNKFLKRECPKAIKQTTFWELRRKKIVIDTSIYMYRFAMEENLIGGMYQLVIILLYYGIIPIFIFDGKPPTEKNELLDKRREEKNKAEKQHTLLLEKINNTKDYRQRNEICAELDVLKKKFVRLSKEDISNVKYLLKLCGVTFFEADGEADELCAKLVIKKRAWACMSEDMDMFVYGCPRVLRYVSLLNETIVMYDTKLILKTLNLSLQEFREICILSGTDYNINETKNANLYTTLHYFNKYKNSSKKNSKFYEWLEGNTNYLIDSCKAYSIYYMFEMSNINIKKYDKHRCINSAINREELRKFLTGYDFIFLN
tara:strand:- start:20305 stop:21264 length:960 start_codon:yes stop_codon:yes gene_type:complete